MMEEESVCDLYCSEPETETELEKELVSENCADWDEVYEGTLSAIPNTLYMSCSGGETVLYRLHAKRYRMERFEILNAHDFGGRILEVWRPTLNKEHNLLVTFEGFGTQTIVSADRLQFYHWLHLAGFYEMRYVIADLLTKKNHFNISRAATKARKQTSNIWTRVAKVRE